jgi:hypothetical protein
MDTFDPIDFARRSAREAFDQAHVYGGLGNSVQQYMVNVRDTLSENDCLNQLDDAIVAFCAEVVEERIMQVKKQAYSR